MQPIQLTKEHRSKLLEMCKKMFPTYTNWCFGKHFDQDELWFSWIDDGYPFPKSSEIHWLEFLITELCDKVFDPKNLHDGSCTGKKKNFLWEVHCYWYFEKEVLEYDNPDRPKHPVDEIYSHFQELKL